jgi:hypothetical protein
MVSVNKTFCTSAIIKVNDQAVLSPVENRWEPGVEVGSAAHIGTGVRKQETFQESNPGTSACN